MKSPYIKDLHKMDIINFEIIGYDHTDSAGRAMWSVICKHCGRQTIKDSRSVQTRNSCGCRRGVRHGLRHHRIYSIYHDMLKRCYNSKTSKFKYYGGKGVEVCQEWREDVTAFYEWSMSHGYAPKLSIDRIDTNGNYSPSNCRWVTMEEQCRSQGCNIKINVEGEKRTLIECSEMFGLKVATLYARFKAGWPDEYIYTLKLYSNLPKGVKRVRRA